MRQTKFLLHAAALLQAAANEQKCFNPHQLSNHERAVESGIIVAATDRVPEHWPVRGVINCAIRFEVRMPTSRDAC